jgi:hypothetical protein
MSQTTSTVGVRRSPLRQRLTLWCLAGSALTTLFAACGGTSATNKDGVTAGAAGDTAGTSSKAGTSTNLGGTESNGSSGSAAGGKPSGGGKAGDNSVPEAGHPGSSAGSGSAGDGGASSAPDTPQLGASCASPGALACAGAHQKLTLVCSADGEWATNQTCPSGQFCSSTPGPDLGVCKAPVADCAARAPSDKFCASDAKTLMQCDVDGLAAMQVQACEARCVDGACAAALPCPENLVYSCDPSCPAPAGTPACFNLCPKAPSGISPLLAIDASASGVKYAVQLPAVTADSAPCTCSELKGATRSVAFQLPANASRRWKLTYPPTWTFRFNGSGVEEWVDFYKSCMGPWPSASSNTPGCGFVTGSGDSSIQVWMTTNATSAEAGTLHIEQVAGSCP